MTITKENLASATTQSANSKNDIETHLKTFQKRIAVDFLGSQNEDHDFNGVHVLESDSGKFLGTFTSNDNHENDSTEKMKGILTTVGTASKTYHLIYSVFIDHHKVIDEAKQEAVASFLKTSVALEEKFGKITYTHQTPANSPSPMLIQKFKKFLGIPYKVVYQAVAWKSEIVICEK